jgi:hypothetical protein
MTRQIAIVAKPLKDQRSRKPGRGLAYSRLGVVSAKAGTWCDGWPLVVGEFVAHDSGLQLRGLNHDSVANLNTASAGVATTFRHLAGVLEWRTAIGLPILNGMDGDQGVLQSERICNGKEHDLPVVR